MSANKVTISTGFLDSRYVNISGDSMTGALINTLATGNSLVWDTNTLIVDATNHRVGIGTAAPQSKLYLYENTPATSITVYINNSDTTSTDSHSFVALHTRESGGNPQVGFGIDNDSTGVSISHSWHMGISNTTTNDDFVLANGTIGSNNVLTIDRLAGKVGIMTVPSAQLHVLSTTEQLRLGYDASNYANFTVQASGGTTLSGAGTYAGYLRTTRLGIGRFAGSYALEVVANDSVVGYFTSSATSGAAIGGTFHNMITNDGAAMAANDRLGGLIIGGAYNASNAVYNSTAIVAYADEDFVAGSGGGRLTFETMTNGTTTRSVRMTIKNDGKVGIGTTSPTYMLDIYQTGTASLQETLFRARVSDAGTDEFSIINNTASDGFFSPLMKGYVQSTATQPAMSFIGQVTSGVDSGTVPVLVFDARQSSAVLATRPVIAFRSYATTYMSIAAGGNVGIGITAPLAKLHVVGSADDEQLIVKGYSSQTANLQEWQASTGTALAYISSAGDMLLNSAVGSILTLARNDTSVLAGDTYGQIDFQTNDSSATFNAIGARIKAEAPVNVTLSSAPADLVFYTTANTAGTALIERLRIRDNGNIGINSRYSQSLFSVGGTGEFFDPASLGSELAQNPDFASATGWTAVAGTLDVSTGKGVLTQTSGTVTALVQNITGLTANKLYKVTVDYYGTLSSNINTGGVSFRFGTTSGGTEFGSYTMSDADRTIDASYTFYVTPTGTNLYIQVRFAGTVAIGVVDNFSMKEVTGGNVISRGVFSGGGTVGMSIDTTGIATFGNKVAFTQTDGNEYIDSLADGYLDIGATTQIRMLADTYIGAKNIVTDTTTGTQLGTSSTQKIALFGATPVVQPAHIADPTGGATVDAEARTAINSINALLATLGLSAAS
jgi:hypothetical protein